MTQTHIFTTTTDLTRSGTRIALECSCGELFNRPTYAHFIGDFEVGMARCQFERHRAEQLREGGQQP